MLRCFATVLSKRTWRPRNVTITSTSERRPEDQHQLQKRQEADQRVAETKSKTTGSPVIVSSAVVAGGTGGGQSEQDGQLCMISRWKSRESERNKVRLRDTDGFRIRAAALCIKGTGKETLVLLVSGGKDGAKWVVPGGGIEKDEEAEEAAHRELMEEAGVRANTLQKMGTFQDDTRKHRTQVFLMEVSEELQTWEENEYGRQRIWMRLDEGAEKVKQSHRALLEAIPLSR